MKSLYRPRTPQAESSSLIAPDAHGMPSGTQDCRATCPPQCLQSQCLDAIRGVYELLKARLEAYNFHSSQIDLITVFGAQSPHHLAKCGERRVDVPLFFFFYRGLGAGGPHV